MFKQLVVPLDGSRLAETVLPTVIAFAQIMHARVILLHMIEANAPVSVHGDAHLTEEGQAEQYLEKIAQDLRQEGIEVDWHVHTIGVKDVARSIVEHVGELGTDLVIMCTHGQSGFRNIVFGSIARKVISLGASPVLLVQPGKRGIAPAFQCQVLLVPLDGNPEHEQSLQVAAQIAKQCGASIHLVAVVHTMSSLPGEQSASAILLPGATAAMLDLSEENAQQYLDELVRRLRAEGIEATTEVKRGDPSRGIIKAARRARASLIVLGTHGKSTMDAFWSGSVTPRVIDRSYLPLLLVPVRTEAKPD